MTRDLREPGRVLHFNPLLSRTPLNHLFYQKSFVPDLTRQINQPKGGCYETSVNTIVHGFDRIFGQP